MTRKLAALLSQSFVVQQSGILAAAGNSCSVTKYLNDESRCMDSVEINLEVRFELQDAVGVKETSGGGHT